METNFQTSFIPKKPMVPERTTKARSVSLPTIISILIFFTVLIATGALYFYKASLIAGIQKMENDLNLAKDRFEPEKISQLEILNRRLEAGNAVLSKHIAISPIFEALSTVTMKSVRYNTFNYSLSEDKDPKVNIVISGMAQDYASIAMQSDLFNQKKYFIDPVFSNLSLDTKGKVLFDLEFSVEPTFVNYPKVLEGKNSQSDETNVPTIN